MAAKIYDFVAPEQRETPEKYLISPRIRLAIDFENAPEAERDDIVPGLIPRRMATLLAGRAGNGKTFICQMLQTAAATALEWFGLSVFQCKSLGVYSEDPEEKLRPRQDKICKHYGIDYRHLGNSVNIMPNDDKDFVLFTCFRRFAAGTPRTTWKNLEEFCNYEGIELVILDNTTNIFEGDHNSKQHVNSFMRWFNWRAREMNAAIVILCNPPKDRSRYFSHTQTWEDAARNTLSLTAPRDEQGKEIDGQLILKAEKANYLPYNHPLKRLGVTLEWQDDIIVRKDTQEPQLLGQLGRLDLEQRIVKAVAHGVDVLGLRFATSPRSPDYLPSVLAGQKQWQHIAWGDLVAALDRLLSGGQLVKVPVKDSWLIRSPDGKAYLGENK